MVQRAEPLHSVFFILNWHTSADWTWTGFYNRQPYFSDQTVLKWQYDFFITQHDFFWSFKKKIIYNFKIWEKKKNSEEPNLENMVGMKESQYSDSFMLTAQAVLCESTCVESIKSDCMRSLILWSVFLSLVRRTAFSTNLLY